MLAHLSRSAVALLVSLISTYVACAQGPPEQFKIPLNRQGEQTALDMRYVAGGELSKDSPQAAAANPAPADAVGLGKIQVTPFYISRTELTFQQLRAILPAETVEGINGRIQRTTGKDNSQEYLRQAVQSSDYPAFSVSLDEAVRVCTTLTEILRVEQGDALAANNIEARRFRLPTHAEWQFACRAAVTVAEAESFPHFNAWTELDALDKNARAMLLEEWEKSGRPVGEFEGTQYQVFDLVDARADAADALGAPEKILSAYFKHSLGRNRDFSKARSLLLPVAKCRPNAWGLFDMHDNVCEWVIVADSRAHVDQLWAGLTSGQADGPPCVLVAGGGFTQAAAKHGWKQFSVWGGFPCDPVSGIPTPVSVATAWDSSDRGMAAELNSGVRLVMERTIRADWLSRVRNAALRQPDAAGMTSLNSFRNTAMQVATSEELLRITTAINAYESLAKLRQSPADEQSQTLVESLNKLAVMSPSTEKSRDRLSRLLGTGNSAKPPPAVSDDAIFVKAANTVFMNQ